MLLTPNHHAAAALQTMQGDGRVFRAKPYWWQYTFTDCARVSAVDRGVFVDSTARYANYHHRRRHTMASVRQVVVSVIRHICAVCVHAQCRLHTARGRLSHSASRGRQSIHRRRLVTATHDDQRILRPIHAPRRERAGTEQVVYFVGYIVTV